MKTKILYLPLKSEYFDAIQSGDKTEEYRLYNDYWCKRLIGRDYDEIILTKGYPKRDDSSRRMSFDWRGYKVKTICHPHFGDKRVKVFAIPVYDGPHHIVVEMAKAGIF